MNKTYGGRYEIEQKIGAGGMAIVYKAKDTLLNRSVAIKVLRDQFVLDEGFIRRFRREAQSAASLSHQNIVSIYDVGKDGDEDYIVMEYVKGMTLKEIIRDQAPLPVEQAIHLARQIGEALVHAHANRIIHRDIKPQNILVTSDGRVKVTDFGIARAVSSATLTHTGDIVGSVHYLSPEQAKGAPINEQSDLYSLGVILYEMLTGKVPHDGDTPIGIALKQIQEEPEPPRDLVPGIPEELNGIVLKSMAKSVQDRYLTGREFLGDLERLLTGQTIVLGKKEPKADADLHQTQIHQGLKDKLGELDAKKLDETLHRNRKRKKVPSFIPIAIALLLALSGVLYGVWQMIYVPEAVVPDVKGLALEEAKVRLVKAGLALDETNVGYVFDDDIKQDRIVSQSYAPNTKVKSGRVIQVSVSKGIEMLAFPNVTADNPLEENAIKMIQAEGFTGKISIERRLSPAIPEGHVIDQNPAPGANWPKNEAIKLFVSSGEVLDMEVMPDVTGMSSQEAKSILEAYKLLVRPESKRSELFPPDAVISTLPSPGKPVKQGSEVLMVISEGPGPAP